MPVRNVSRTKVKKTERSWFARNFATIVVSTLVFSTVSYAITWPTDPGDTGFPLAGSFWTFFDKMLADTGATSDGTVKKSASLGIAGGRTVMVTDTNGNIGLSTGATAPYALSVSGQALFSDTVVGTTPTASGHFATKGYVDASVSAGGGGGGYNQCYRIHSDTPAYPTCTSGFTRVYAAYGDRTPTGGSTSNYALYFEGAAGYWFNQYGHVYLYYDDNAGANTYGKIFDDQDLELAGNSYGWCNMGRLAAVFSAQKSTYMGYSSSGSIDMACNSTYMSEFGYAVCCK